MNCRIEEIDTFGRKLYIDIPAADFNERINAKLRELSTTAKIKGFRPGKAPLEIIKRYYGAEVKSEAASSLVYEGYKEAMKQHPFHVLSNPSFEDMEMDTDKGINYTVYIEVLPDLQLNTYADITIEKPACEITEADIDAMVKRVRKNHTKWQVTDEPARVGDRVTVNLGIIKTSEEPAELNDDQSYILGSNPIGERFDKQIENMRAGEEKEIDFGEDAEQQTLDSDKADKLFKVCLKLVEEPILPEMDDDFFKICGVEEGGLDALRNLLREGMEWELKRKISQLHRTNVENVMLTHGNIKAPPTMLKEQTDKMKEIFAKSDTNYSEKNISDELFEKTANRQVCLNILFMHISQKNNFKADRSACEAKINELGEDYKDPERIKNYYRSDANAYRKVEAIVVEDKVIDYVIERANMSEKKYPFYELMDMEKTQ